MITWVVQIGGDGNTVKLHGQRLKKGLDEDFQCKWLVGDYHWPCFVESASSSERVLFRQELKQEL